MHPSPWGAYSVAASSCAALWAAHTAVLLAMVSRVAKSCYMFQLSSQQQQQHHSCCCCGVCCKTLTLLMAFAASALLQFSGNLTNFGAVSNLNAFQGWSTASVPCSWTGVLCDGYGQVTSLYVRLIACRSADHMQHCMPHACAHHVCWGSITRPVTLLLQLFPISCLDCLVCGAFSKWHVLEHITVHVAKG